MADEPQRIVRDGMIYLLDPGRAEAIQREVLDDLEGLEWRRGVSLVKRNNVRTVLRVPFGDEVLFVKRYHVRGPREWVKYLFVSSRAVTEWRAARGMRAAGLPTVEAVMMGELRTAGILRDGCLATVGIPDGDELVPYIRRRLRGGDHRLHRRELLLALARLVRRFHDEGFAHGDLHGGNILLTGDPGESRIHLLDLHTVKRRRRVGRRTRLANLSKMLHSLTTASSRADRLRMLRAYEGDAPVLGAIRTARARVESRMDALERRRQRSRTKRCLRRSSAFDHARVGPFLVRHRREAHVWSVLSAVGDHLLSVKWGRREVLKDSHRSAISRQLLAGPPELARVVVKETRCRRLADLVKNAFRRPRGLASWVNGNGLTVRRVKVARPLALVSEGRWPVRRASWLLMEDLSGDERLDLFVLARYAGPIDAARREEKRSFVRAFGRFVGRLHRTGVYHGDLKAVNVFVRWTGEGEPGFRLVDYDRVRFGRSVSRRRRIKNLAQVAASVAVLITKTDRLRFFRAYAWEPEVAAGAAEYGRGVERQCRRKIVVRMEPIE